MKRGEKIMVVQFFSTKKLWTIFLASLIFFISDTCRIEWSYYDYLAVLHKLHPEKLEIWISETTYSQLMIPIFARCALMYCFYNCSVSGYTVTETTENLKNGNWNPIFFIRVSSKHKQIINKVPPKDAFRNS